MPTTWADSTLHFLTKPNKPAKRAQDLRPIALQSAGAKAVLLTVKDRLMPFLLAAMVQLPQYAYVAYVAGRGATEAILRVTLHCSHIRDVIQAQKMTIHDRFAGTQRAACAGGLQMSLDLSKAFDMLSHEVLVLATSRAGVAHLDGALQDIRAIFDVLRALGTQVNPTKSSLLLGLRGPLADKWLKRHASRDRAVRHLRYGPALRDRIPIVPSFVYLGVVISYRNFEDLTLRHRLAIAAGHHARLRRILHARKVLTSPERARLWTVLIQSAQLYALEAVGVTKEGMRLLHVQTTKHLRGIFGTARHIDGLSDAAFYDKYRLVNTHMSLTQRCDSLCRRLAGAPTTAVPCFEWQALLTRAVTIRDALPGPHDAKASRHATADTTVSAASFPKEEVFSCSQCSQVFHTLHDLKTHEGRAHGIILSRVQVDKNDHGTHGLPTCRHCGIRFAKWHSLSRQTHC